MPPRLLCTAVMRDAITLWEKTSVTMDPAAGELETMIRVLKIEARQKMLDAGMQALAKAVMGASITVDGSEVSFWTDSEGDELLTD